MCWRTSLAEPGCSLDFAETDIGKTGIDFFEAWLFEDLKIHVATDADSSSSGDAVIIFNL